MSIRARAIAYAMTGLIAAALSTSNARGATPEQIDKAIRQGVSYLYSQQTQNGSWEKFPTKPVLSPRALGAGIDDGQWGGKSALVTYALLAAGERPLDPRIIKATDWLRTAPIGGFYALGMRANVWLNLPETKANKEAMARDASLLRSGISKAKENQGFYTYLGTGKGVDLSCSQYGVLGAWAAAQQAQEFSLPYWTAVEKAWQNVQQPDGSWAYRGKPTATDPPNIQMTAAGVATLFITQEFLHTEEGIDGVRGNIKDLYISKGLAWIGANLPGLLQTPSFYAMYGIERIGVASGYKYLGSLDWFQAGADVLVKSQDTRDGHWANSRGHGAEIDTSFALLFLSRGRAPVMINKLQYKLAETNGKPAIEANWNQRPRDVANATRWVENKAERKLNWQNIDLNVASVDDLHDSAIAYLSGNQPLTLSDSDKAKLKQYIEEGGLLIGNADAGKADFAKAFRALGHELFPDYEFATLDAKSTNVLMSGEQFPAAQWKRNLKIEALGNKARWFMLLIPTDDAGRVLQRRENAHEEVFQFFANTFLYSVDKFEARFKGQTYVVRAKKDVKTTRTIKIARLKYKGLWDPEPAGWSRVAAVLMNDNQTQLAVQTVELGKDSLDGYKIAYLTGADQFALTNPQREAIKKFISSGGLLLADACGGRSEFSTAFADELGKIFPTEAGPNDKVLAKDDPVYIIDNPKDLAPNYRTFAIQQMGAEASQFRLHGLRFGGKLGIVYSNEDLSVGLVGQPVDGIRGYQPATALQLVKRLILLKDAGKI